MKINCTECKAPLVIPDEKLARKNGAGKKLNFKCPKCGGTLSLPPEPAPPPELVPEQSALIMVGDRARQQLCSQAAGRHGFGVKMVESMVEATFMVEYQSFPLVIVDDSFDQSQGVDSFLDFINRLDIERRRRFCLVMIESGAATGDPMAALRYNVNYMLGDEGMGRFEEVLGDALKAHKDLYRVYKKAREKLERI
ncbi:MAG: zinc-ribbon domain-containing protein [Desulfobacterales bacterium]|nr:zinc-ribbon domain-containing protein [Desulfobacterales bacterium]